MNLVGMKFTALFVTWFAIVNGINAAPISGQGTWETTLSPRDLNSDGTVDAWYDSALDITWLEDSNLPDRDDMGGVVGISSDGFMQWNTAVAYVGKMNSQTYLGRTGWRLPRHIDLGNDGCATGMTNSGGDCSWNPDPGTGELAYMFLVTLGNETSVDPATGAIRPGSFFGAPGNTGPFTHMRAFDNYWYGQEDVTNPAAAWSVAAVGGQASQWKGFRHPIWPVLDGDVGVHLVEALLVEPSQKSISEVLFTVIDANQNTAEINVTLVVHSEGGC